MIADLRQDAGYAVRSLGRTPGFSALAIATLALGIAAATSIFTIVDSVLVRPLAFPEPHRLTMLLPSSGSRLSPEYFHDWRLESRTFDDIAAWYDERATLTGRGEAVEVLVDRVTSNFFDVFRAPPLAGRTFTTEQTLGVAPREVVLSHGFWQRRYAGDRGVVGQPVTLDGEVFTIVGVMSRDFAVRTNELAESRAEVWRPFPLVVGNRRGMGGFLNVVGRLSPHVSANDAQAELSLIARRIDEENSTYSRDWRITVVPLLDATVRDVRLMLLVLFGGVAILLITACVERSEPDAEPQRDSPNRIRHSTIPWRHERQIGAPVADRSSCPRRCLGGARHGAGRLGNRHPRVARACRTSIFHARERSPSARGCCGSRYW